MKGIADGIFNLSMAVSILILSVGVVNGAMEGKPFAPQPALRFLLNLVGRTQRASDYASGRASPNKPITPEDVGFSISENNAGICLDSSQETGVKEELPTERLDRFKKYKSRVRTIWDVQALLGNPNCIEGKTWTYYFQDGSRLVVKENKDVLDVQLIDGI